MGYYLALTLFYGILWIHSHKYHRIYGIQQSIKSKNEKMNFLQKLDEGIRRLDKGGKRTDLDRCCHTDNTPLEFRARFDGTCMNPKRRAKDGHVDDG